MAYNVELSDLAIKQLNELDKPVGRMILKWLKKNVEGCDNPRAHGKLIKGNLSEYWRYRVGDYRILCMIKDDVLIVQAIKIEHRSTIYR